MNLHRPKFRRKDDKTSLKISKTSTRIDPPKCVRTYSKINLGAEENEEELDRLQNKAARERVNTLKLYCLQSE